MDSILKVYCREYEFIYMLVYMILSSFSPKHWVPMGWDTVKDSPLPKFLTHLTEANQE